RIDLPYQEYFRSATEALVVVDRHGRIVEVNASAGRLFGYRSSELVDLPVDALLPERLRGRHRSLVEGYFAAPRSRPIGIGLALVGKRKDGSEVPIEVSLTYAPRTSRGDLVVASITDIRERLRLEHAARRSETLASLATIAHELNQPLGAILSNAQAA